jgi:hypothetical protein
MKHSDFQIGAEFYTLAGKWRCTDIGSRVVVAIRIDDQEPPNLVGPPYSVAEDVFDEYDVGGCSLDPREFEHAPMPSKGVEPTPEKRRGSR